MRADDHKGESDGADPAVLAQLAERFRTFVDAECNRYTPLYARIGNGIADDPAVLSILAAARRGQRRPVLLLAAAHHLILAEPDAEVARYYPSVTGKPVPEGDPYPAFRKFCLARREALIGLVSTRATQTNEVNRVVALRALLSVAATDAPEQPIALLEVGASAGLNLLFDRMRIEVDAQTWGDPRSPVVAAARQVGPLAPPIDAPLPPVVCRCGLDREPRDVNDTEAMRWLEACLWPEQVERVGRLRAAVALARQDPPTLVRGDMIEDLVAVAAQAPTDAHLVVWHSWALTYLPRHERPRFAGAVSELASGRRSLTWLSAEPPGTVPGPAPPAVPADANDEVRFATVLGVQPFRGGMARDARAVGRCHAHLRWIEWFAAEGGGR